MIYNDLHLIRPSSIFGFAIAIQLPMLFPGIGTAEDERPRLGRQNLGGLLR